MRLGPITTLNGLSTLSVGVEATSTEPFQSEKGEEVLGNRTKRAIAFIPDARGVT